MNLTDRTAANAVRSLYSTLNVEPPEALGTAWDNADKLAAKAGQLGAKPGDLPSAVVAAILADRDPSTDPDVQRVITAHALMANAGLPDAITGAAIEDIREVCLAHRDQIITGWRVAFDEAAAALAAAHGRIGGLDLDDAVSILAKGGDIADSWATARAADRTISAVVDGWSDLMRLIRVNPDPRHRALRLAALSLEQYRTMPAKLSGWDAVRAGLRLSLPTLDEYRARITALEQATAAEQSAPRNVVPGDRLAVQAMGRELEAARQAS